MRDTFIVFFAIIIALILGAYLYFNHADGVPLPGGIPAQNSIVILQEGSNAGAIDMRTNYRIQNDEDLTSLWNLIYANNGPIMPTVDFSTYEVIAAFDGSHSTSGYRVEVTEVRDTDAARTVHIRRTSPSARCATTPGISNPYQIVRVPRTVLPITKEEEEVTAPC